jgi:ankyrin repeat domain-containing protein 50
MCQAELIGIRYDRHPGSELVNGAIKKVNDESKQDTSALLRALLLQLPGQITGLDAELARLKETYHYCTPPVPILSEYLRQAVNRCRHIYLLLDALDESPAETSRADVLSIIGTIRRWQLPGLHLLVTSRNIVNIRESLNTEANDMVQSENNDVDQDILRYVSYQVEHDRQLKRWGSHRETIKQHLIQRANGV